MEAFPLSSLSIDLPRSPGTHRRLPICCQEAPYGGGGRQEFLRSSVRPGETSEPLSPPRRQSCHRHLVHPPRAQPGPSEHRPPPPGSKPGRRRRAWPAHSPSPQREEARRLRAEPYGPDSRLQETSGTRTSAPSYSLAENIYIQIRPSMPHFCLQPRVLSSPAGKELCLAGEGAPSWGADSNVASSP